MFLGVGSVVVSNSSRVLNSSLSTHGDGATSSNPCATIVVAAVMVVVFVSSAPSVGTA